MIHPHLTLVGAGPGDEDLITLKGIKALESANVVMYDALANPALLKYAPEAAERVFVGKRAGQHLFQQRQINRMVVRYAREYGHVVRLKGGDPFIFGRGQEEKTYALRHGLTVSVVPGISSALAVPATHGIPLTHRGANESFWVVTGTTKDERLPNDMLLAAQSSATVVILMGMKRLAEIVSLFSTHRGHDELIAVIQNGTCADEKHIVCRLRTIENAVAQHAIGSPAVIVIGAVVQQRLTSIRQQLATVGR